jgi:parvulin-like peptidyl-prolyl isomerase
MKTIVILLLFMSGCATSQLPDSSGTLPVLIYQVPLPGYDRINVSAELRIDLKLHIAKDSSVQEVLFLSSNTDSRWETSAIEEIRKWRFLPALQNGVPVPVWIRQTIIIRPAKLLKMSLSQILCRDRRDADSIYSLLQMGEDFDSLARTVSQAPSREQNGKLGLVNIRTFPFHIQKELEKLNIGEITPPLPLGRSFVIFKWLKTGIELEVE